MDLPPNLDKIGALWIGLDSIAPIPRVRGPVRSRIGAMSADLPGFPARTEHSPAPDDILTVSELNRLARRLLESEWPSLCVVGEISNLTWAASGHLYFTLKDAQAQVRCTMWRGKAALLPFRPENGMRVEARAAVTLYEARGDFQLNVEALVQAGRGSLFEAFLRLKDKLATEGLFDPAAKRALPRFPRRIGIVTSPAAAAYQDVLATLRRRAPHLGVVLYAASVQGVDAGTSLVEAVESAAARAGTDHVDVLLLVRGGGSLEDLWGFNDERLARAIRRCPIPVVSGVGHETDFTIADFAADLRAATPTGAAELVTAGYHEAAARLAVLQRMFARAIEGRLNAAAQRVDRAGLRLIHPRERLRQSEAALGRLAERLDAAIERRLERAASATRVLALRLQAGRPRLERPTGRCTTLAERLRALGHGLLQDRAQRLASLAAHLEHLGPQAVLARGYSITRDADGHILRSAAQVACGARIGVQLATGRLGATVTERQVDEDDGIVIEN